GDETGDRQAVLGHARGEGSSCRRDDDSVDGRKPARVDRRDGDSCRRRRRGEERGDDDGDRPQEAVHSKPPNFGACCVSRMPGPVSSSGVKKLECRPTPFAASLSRNCGFRPVHRSGDNSRLRLPNVCESSSGGFATKTSWRVITSDSMRKTSVTCVIRRLPSTSLEICTSRSKALEICSRIARSGRSTPAVSTSVSRRLSASRGEFAWI